MSDGIGKIIEIVVENTAFLDQMVMLGIEYQTKNITAERFSQRVCEILVEYQARSKAHQKWVDEVKK